MRAFFLVAPLIGLLVACGGVAAPESSSSQNGNPPGEIVDPPGVVGPNTPPVTPPSTTHPPSDCANPEVPAVYAGGTIARPTGSALRLELVYQGSAIGVRKVRGVDMVLAPTVGPFKSGYNSGYWADVVDASGGPLYTSMIQDPTNIEGVGPGGGFSNSSIDKCVAKTILVDAPNAATASELVIYGSPYGTQDAAVELARFSIK